MNVLISYILCLFALQFQINDAIYINERDFDGYIFHKKHFIFLSIENQKERYTPEKEDVIKAEEIIKQNIHNANIKLMNQGGDCPIIHKNLKKYSRQYFGFINEHGDKIIWVNFVWKTKSTEDQDCLSKDLYYVLDGCSFYWNVTVNLSSGKLFDLHINGSS